MRLTYPDGFLCVHLRKIAHAGVLLRFEDTFLHRRDFQYLEMVTESAYMSLAGQSIKMLVKEDKREEFANVKDQWFPREDTP